MKLFVWNKPQGHFVILAQSVEEARKIVEAKYEEYLQQKKSWEERRDKGITKYTKGIAKYTSDFPDIETDEWNSALIDFWESKEGKALRAEEYSKDGLDDIDYNVPAEEPDIIIDTNHPGTSRIVTYTKGCKKEHLTNL